MSESELVVDYEGTQRWYLKGHRGVLHNTRAPALVWTDGTEWWFLQGKPHRTDGPAKQFSDGTQEWYINGARCADFAEWLERLDADAKTKTLLTLKWAGK